MPDSSNSAIDADRAFLGFLASLGRSTGAPDRASGVTRRFLETLAASTVLIVQKIAEQQTQALMCFPEDPALLPLALSSIPDEFEEDHAAAPGVHPFLVRWGVKSLASIPFAAPGFAGAMLVFWRAAHRLAVHERETLLAMASFLRVAVECGLAAAAPATPDLLDIRHASAQPAIFLGEDGKETWANPLAIHLLTAPEGPPSLLITEWPLPPGAPPGRLWALNGITVPASLSLGEAPALVVNDLPIAPAHSGPLRGKRVLIVEPGGGEPLALHLRAAGMEIAAVSTGIEALRLLLEANRGSRPFDLAIVDLQTPLMDGITLARTLRSQPGLKQLPLLLLAAPGSGPSLDTRALGIQEYLPAPVDRERLIRAAEAALDRRAARSESVETPPRSAARPFKARILLAEDNRVNQTVGALFLKRLGHEVDVVPDGRDAFEAFQRSGYDLILMDCEMPELDGYAATDAIRRAERETGRRVPIVALTANVMPGTRELCLAAGMDDYISKPLRAGELAEKLTRWISPRAPDS